MNAADIHTDLAGLITDVGANGAGLTALPWNAAWDAEVQSECDDAITANTLIVLLKTILAHKSIENEAGTLVTYRTAGDAGDAGTQSWSEATKTRGEYTAS